MDDKRAPADAPAAKLVAATFGVFAGLGGLVHGVGEILQGNVAPDGLIINSWTQGPIASNMGGEPGMTIVPNLLLTGILAVVISLAVIVWAALSWGAGAAAGRWSFSPSPCCSPAAASGRPSSASSPASPAPPSPTMSGRASQSQPSDVRSEEVGFPYPAVRILRRRKGKT